MLIGLISLDLNFLEVDYVLYVNTILTFEKRLKTTFLKKGQKTKRFFLKMDSNNSESVNQGIIHEQYECSMAAQVVFKFHRSTPLLNL